MSDRDVDPWERRPKEPARAYEAFRAYRDAGPTRTLDDAGDHPRHLLVRWRGHNGWEKRARAWDAEVHRLEDQRRLEQIRTMEAEHQQVGRALIAAGVRALQAAPALTPHQAARFVDLGTRLERAAIVGERLGPAGAGVVDVDEDVSPLERIARELAGTA